jgi:uncharacterized damage-inducible protein DinB
MRNVIFAVLLACCLAASATAQSGQPAAKDAAATWLRGAYMNQRNNLARSAEKMPEEFYNLRPGAQSEVRTFGQLIGHVANFNYLWCSDAKGEQNPAQATDFEKVTSKAGLVKALNEALYYCDGVYGALTDASAMQMVTVSGPNGQPTQVLRLARLIQNHAHNNEHYGNIVTYMRIKSIVPPSSQQP